jgi:hypothetical protein
MGGTVGISIGQVVFTNVGPAYLGESAIALELMV